MNFFENISEIFEDEGYYTLSSLNSAITQNIKLNSMIYSIKHMSVNILTSLNNNTIIRTGS